MESAIFQELLEETSDFLSSNFRHHKPWLLLNFISQASHKASPSLRDGELNPMLREWQSYIAEEKLRWWILLWPSLEDIICQTTYYLNFHRTVFNSLYMALYIALPGYFTFSKHLINS